MDFGDVIKRMKEDKNLRFTRTGWNGKGMFISKVVPDCPVKLPYLVMFTATKQFVPWLASQTDMLAEDWMEIGIELPAEVCE